MALFHIDPVNGNDANTGLSWAQAWKTFTNGATAARIAPGDDIKVAKTADPTSIGTATWTDGKIGNSITFATAPTKQIDTCKSGWVTMGSGSTVTNGQTTAYVTPVTFGATTVGALQWTTSGSANGCYKDLGSNQDFSGYQLISFWFRTTSNLDCTTSQKLVVELCSDAAGTSVMSSLTAPAWLFQANTWYPLVLDQGSPLWSSVRSVRIRTLQATTATFYVDEMFASPAGGLTLWSLIGLNNGAWYPIRAVRNADVVLMSGCSMGAANCSANSEQQYTDASWNGTTQTATTWKLEPTQAYLPSAGPSSTSYCVNMQEAATTTLPRLVSGGWNTVTDVIDGETWADGVCNSYGTGIRIAAANYYTTVTNFGIVRYNIPNSSSTEQYQLHNVSFVANANSLSATTITASQNWPVIKNCIIKCVTGNNGSGFVPFQIGVSAGFLTATLGEVWGNAATSFGTFMNISPVNATVTLSNIFTLGQSSYVLNLGGLNTYYTAGTIGFQNSAFSYTKNLSIQSLGQGCSLTATSITTANNSSSGNNFAQDSTISTNLFAHTGTDNIGTYNGSVRALNPQLGGLIFPSGGSINRKITFHDWQGVPGNFRTYVSDSKTSAPSYFELQAIDVYTPGSKAIKWNGATYAATDAVMNHRLNLKIASAAAEANKLVTITARVKRNTASINAGIYVDGARGFVPGITTDVSSSTTTVNEWELETITFTPTANCVFDVYAFVTPTGAGTPFAVWDALTITQAA